MANELPPIVDEAEEKKRLKDEKKKLKEEKKKQQKEVKARAKELERQEKQLESENDPKGGSVFAITLVIIVIWLAILALLVRLDVGGFGSGVLAPILRDVPVLNAILPPSSDYVNLPELEPDSSYYGYSDLREAVDYIRQLEYELERAQSVANTSTEEVSGLRAEVARLREFEDRQVEFQRIRNEFYDEVIYADRGPGIEEYKKFFEAIDPVAAEMLYKQVVVEIEESNEVKDFARAYSEMRPKAAAAIFEEMTDNLNLAARILKTMDAGSRGEILGAMDPEIAAQLTKIMEPDL